MKHSEYKSRLSREPPCSTCGEVAQSRLTHQGLSGMEQEGKKWKGEHSRALPIIHVALAKTALYTEQPNYP